MDKRRLFIYPFLAILFVINAVALSLFYVEAKAYIQWCCGLVQGVLIVALFFMFRTELESTGDAQITGMLRQEEQRFKTALEAAPQAMLMVDAQKGQVVLANKQMETMFGYTREELLGKSIEMLIPERFRESHPGHRNNFMLSPKPRAMGAGRDLYGVRKDGQEIPVEIGLTPVETKEGLFVISSIVDISERKAHEQRFKTALEAAPQAMLMVDAQKGQIVLANKQMETMFGYTREELLGKSIEMLIPERFHESHPDHRNNFMLSPKPRAMGAGRDLYGVRKDGQEIPVEIGLTPVTTPEGLFVISSIVDISERKSQEELLTQKNEELEQFVYTVSHDLKAPLVSISGFSQRLMKYKSGTLDEKGQRYLNRILANVKMMETLIKELLDLSRVAHRELQLAQEGMKEMIQEALRTLGPQIQEKKATIVLDDIEFPKVYCQKNLVLQVLTNIISNSIKYCQEDESPKLVIGGQEKSRDFFTFYIQDNGIGIAPEHQKKAFRIFERIEPGKAEGTGVGLAIVKKIIERHGGEVWLESELGKGTTFYFTLPLINPAVKGVLNAKIKAT